MEESGEPAFVSSSLDEPWEDQDSSSQPSSDTYLLGFVIADIVGLQYYRGTIKRSVAAVLAPLIDSHLIVVEGIVPNSRSSVKSAISRGGLNLIAHSDVSFTLSEAAVVKGNRAGGESRSLDKVFKLVEKNVSKKAEMATVEPPNEVIIPQLLLHQKEGLGWLLHKENSNELLPLWEEKGGEFINVLTNYQTDKRPEPLRGGIFADDMGLGKTLTLLSLIAFDKFGSIVPNSGDFVVEENFEENVKKGKRGRVSKQSSGTRKKQKAKGKSVVVADESQFFRRKNHASCVSPPLCFHHGYHS
ncbi:Detected protein of unknown function [Hibiscus syriacus]|uniref:SNF2 N-terminal domain-containing protein n=1 Tax=Hibiscus syriacus TaxID=106335 RepID=A0A6A2YYZ1_HIBSY|nr:Detected protein of unknown function [Hibiscus syriacus]